MIEIRTIPFWHLYDVMTTKSMRLNILIEQNKKAVSAKDAIEGEEEEKRCSA